MIDFDALVLGPAYATFGVEAQVTLAGTDGRAETLTVQDNTAGITVAFEGGRGRVVDRSSGDLSIATLRPAAAVRVGELTGKELTPADLNEAAIAFNGRIWRIKGHLPKPSNGADSGEIYLLLEASA